MRVVNTTEERKEPEPRRRPAVVSGPGDRKPRWVPGERLHHLFEARCDQVRATGDGGRLAVSGDDGTLTFAELDAWANQLARHLLGQGVRPGERVALLFEYPVYSYVAMLAVLKVCAAYVPLDASFPPERIAFITEDAGVSVVLCQASLADRLREVPVCTVLLDAVQEKVEQESDERLAEAATGPAVDELAYVIYTSGSTGTPKGVAVEHASIVNFARVAAEGYGYRPGDRVYQGLTIAFDFSVEEIWVPLLAGATLVPKPSGAGGLVGDELGEFLREQRITALCCVPTLLASLDVDLPDLRFLLVSGEACPQDLVARWWSPQRRFLNVYGPTEATVTATWALLRPDEPVVLGEPLPTYTLAIVDPHSQRVLEQGGIGEIAIAGIGLAREYLNRPEKTAQSFVPDFLGVDSDHNPSGRLYRTGDLGTLNASGQIEYHGRIDTQVKVRGYRIELTEIESVLLGFDGIAQAVVDTHQSSVNAAKELVAYYSLTSDSTRLDPDALRQVLREQLPGYMVPAYLQQLPTIPLMTSGKADRNNLPAPSHRHRKSTTITPARTDTEHRLATALAGVLDLPVDDLSVTADLFDDLGTNSLHLARFRAQLRDDPRLPPISMREAYEHPTIADLAASLPEGDTQPEAENAAPSGACDPDTEQHAVSGLQYALCGLGQVVSFAGYLFALTWLFNPGFDWVAGANDLGETYLRSVVVGAGLFATACLAPVALKWVLIGRWESGEIPLWGWRYLRFWFVRTLLRANPMMFFLGTPLYTVYLRALGAHIGRDVLILSRYLPICTDLIFVGAHSVIRKDVFCNGYRAQGTRIQTGTVAIGEYALIGEGSVLDINTEMGDHAQLAHASALHTGESLPAHTRWHGSPAEPTTVDYLNIERGHAPGPVRKTVHCATQLLPMLLIYLPVSLGVLDETVLEGRWTLPIGTPAQSSFYLFCLAIATILFLGSLVVGLTVVTLLPRLLDLLLTPERVYPLYGLQYGAHRFVFKMSNAKLFMRLFGDSSLIVYYLRALGYRLAPVQQTGSNFGVQQKHETPFLTTVGTGTMVSDGLSTINAWHSSTSFRMEGAAIGAHNFVGNMVRYPSGARIGDNVLLATKTLVPLEGELQENTGLLGSPAFAIPRSVRRDEQINYPANEQQFRRALRGKNRHNAATLGLYLAALWGYCLGLVTLSLFVDFFPELPAITDTVAELGGLVLTLGYFALLERASLGFRRLRPRTCSIYERPFWRHERFWKFGAPMLPILDGTPLKPMLLRLLGVQVGRQVFDDGCGIPEKTLVTIGDRCALNMGTVLQAHSLEDGGFKSDYLVVESDSTLRTGAFAHYGTTIGPGSTVDADSFLMKGEEIGPYQVWRGNPAQEVITGTVRPSHGQQRSEALTTANVSR